MAEQAASMYGETLDGKPSSKSLTAPSPPPLTQEEVSEFAEAVGALKQLSHDCLQLHEATDDRHNAEAVQFVVITELWARLYLAWYEANCRAGDQQLIPELHSIAERATLSSIVPSDLTNDRSRALWLDLHLCGATAHAIVSDIRNEVDSTALQAIQTALGPMARAIAEESYPTPDDYEYFEAIHAFLGNRLRHSGTNQESEPGTIFVPKQE